MLIALLLAARPNPAATRGLPGAQTMLPKQLGGCCRADSCRRDSLAGLRRAAQPAHLLGAVVSSFVTWGIEAGAYWIVMRAFDLELELCGRPAAGRGGQSGRADSGLARSVGVNEFVVISILTALGIAAPLATAYAVVAHITIWLPITRAGFALLLKQGLGWADISRREHDPQGSAESAGRSQLDINRRIKVSQQRLQFVPKFVRNMPPRPHAMLDSASSGTRAPGMTDATCGWRVHHCRATATIGTS